VRIPPGHRNRDREAPRALIIVPTTSTKCAIVFLVGSAHHRRASIPARSQACLKASPKVGLTENETRRDNDQGRTEAVIPPPPPGRGLYRQQPRGEPMILGIADRRRRKRYDVSWDATLEVGFPDQEVEKAVKVVNISAVGVIFHLDRIYLGNRHLILGDQPPTLRLRMPLTEGAFQCQVQPRWHDSMDDGHGFVMGAEFVGVSSENAAILGSEIGRLRKV